MRSAFFVILLGAFVIGCGAGSRPNTGGDDDNPMTDAPMTPPADGPGMQSMGIGSTCTPDQANPQGDCPVGFQCLSLQGGTNAWCSKTCTAGTGDTCGTGYTGPGKAQCIYQITPSGGGAAESFCGVVCQDQTANNQICPTATCNGTCPGTLACSAPLTDQNMTTVAQACQ